MEVMKIQNFSSKSLKFCLLEKKYPGTFGVNNSTNSNIRFANPENIKISVNCLLSKKLKTTLKNCHTTCG